MGFAGWGRAQPCREWWGALWACGNTAERKGECVYNSIFSLIVFPFLSFLDNWIDKSDEARVVELEKMFFG